MSDDPDLAQAYALQTPQDSVRLYDAWAASYDTDFAQASDYILHTQVARHFVMVGGFGPVLDIGAGTGLCGAALHARGITPVDGTDISPRMIHTAQAKGIYRDLFVADILQGADPSRAPYQGAVSSGTFTNGHVGPAGIDTVLAMVRPRAWIVLSINARHHAAQGFAAKMTQLGAQITDVSQTEVAIYGPDATGPHARDTALLLAFRKA